MALSSSLTTKAASTDTTSIGGHLRAAGATASHGVARSLETLRRMAIAMSVDATGHAAIGNGNGNGNANGNANGNDDSSGRGHGNGNGNGLGHLHHQQSGSIHARLSIHKRHLGGGAIAGITVGVIVAVALLAICLYPCLLYLRRRHRGRGRGTSHAALDAEAAIAGTAAGHGSNASNGASSPPKRLSSSDSYKHKGELTRGGSTDHDWQAAAADHNGYPLPLNAAYLQPGDPGFTGNGLGAEYRVKAEPFLPLGLDDGEFAPRVSADHQPGVLKGTSADYYSPDIPSEAFGMVAQPEPPLDSPIQPSSSRTSSFRYNMKQMFRRKSGRDATLDSAFSQATITRSLADGAIPLQTNITAGDRVESPVSFSAVSLPLSRSSSSRQRGTGAEAEAEAEAESRLGPVSPPVSNAAEPASKRTPPESPHLSSYQRFQKSPSPPVAAPGTVNPMDIMPASTEAEVWHKTEHQLYEAFHKPSPSDPAIDTAMPSPSPTPPETQAQPTFTVQTPGSTNRTEFIPDSNINNINNSNNGNTNSSHDQQQIDTGDVVMLDAGAALPLTHDHTLTAPDGRHPSYPSDQSTPLPGPAFTDVSSQNTPSTQLDTPSPQSVGSSDFRHSASPQSGAGGHSPRTGVYRCEEPGCNQTFDQPHKLKHHQRYHSKDHKCPYSGCGKGFGTKTHLQRHINDRHEKKKKFHCSVTGCDYSRSGGKAFPRKDNWKRHMIKIHNIEQQSLPEPIEVDMDVDGS